MTETDYTSFEDFDLGEDILRGIYGYGFIEPSPPQKKGIAPCLGNGDVLLQAESGTGKTAAFCIPILQKVDCSNPETQMVILSPTRDIALQHSTLLKELSKYMEGLTIIECIGGLTKSYDMARSIRNGGQIICGTVGRVKDMMSRGAFNMSRVHMVVLDEADVLLDRDFRYEVKDIMEEADPEVQLCLFSATMTNETLDFANKILRKDATVMLLEQDSLTLEGIKQFYVGLDCDNDKIAVIEDLFGFLEVSQSLIFVNSKQKAIMLEEELRKRNYTLSVITGDMKQEDRNMILSEFRCGKSRIMVCSDLIARGIDVKGVKLVINFDFPNDRENYIHRIGRSGRYGSKGVAINLITENELSLIKEVESFYHTEINELPSDIEDLI